ncbi:hypothetical protein LN042_02625 [Kitasatospora sp. RB6PN24]|uniref:hypothetical protein n=1 Tax=Kitasatospora humi TaxID=2893891 RepID=UPI001E47B112|nr:hypothetical protein [Kitasatospora humi]MCC9306012.1 hypothetical protein [Kitasatospora humi]
MATTDPEAPPDPEASLVDKVKNILGFLLAGFVAALNFLGFQNSEITAILRNDPLEATLVGGLMLLALTTAVVSIFLPNRRTMPPYFLPAIFAACIGLTPLVICVINIPLQTTSDTCRWASLSATVLFVLMLALGFYWCGWQRAFAWMTARMKRQKPPGARPGVKAGITSVLLVCALILTTVAMFAAARLEVRSQASAAYPGISATMKSGGGTEDLSLTITGSKLAAGDKIGLIVQAVPRSMDLVKACSGSWRLDDCLSKGICNATSKNPCDVVVSSELEPDSAGQVNVTMEEPVSTSQYQFVDVRAQICDIDWTTDPGPGKASPRTCTFDKDKTTVAFLRVPSS